jgi:DNA transformation protein
MNISDLPNFGPKSQETLARAGIRTLEQLRALGSVRAYVQVKRSGACTSLNLLWAIEGALSQRSWRDVAKYDRLRLLMELEIEEGKTHA